MTLVLEDGSCVTNANAFVENADLIAYAGDFRPDLTIEDDTSTSAAIMRASAWLSVYPDWEGSLACGRGNQGLAWPRSDVEDCNGDEVPDDEVPIEVKQATYIAAIAELASPGVLSPTITPGLQKKRERVEGAVDVSYMTPQEQSAFQGSSDPSVLLRPVLTSVSDILKCMATFPDGSQTSWPIVV